MRFLLSCYSDLDHSEAAASDWSQRGSLCLFSSTVLTTGLHLDDTLSEVLQCNIEVCLFVYKPQGAVKVWSHREWGREEEEDHGFNRRENL